MLTADTLPVTVDKIVKQFTKNICSIQPDFIEGIYLTGSLSLNDFYANKSDIDFLVICKALPDDQLALKLKSIHKTITIDREP